MKKPVKKALTEEKTEDFGYSEETWRINSVENSVENVEKHWEHREKEINGSEREEWEYSQRMNIRCQNTFCDRFREEMDE